MITDASEVSVTQSGCYLFIFCLYYRPICLASYK